MGQLGIDTNVLGLFAKRPDPGRVKTRLAAATSTAFAARIAEAFLLDSLDRLATVAARRVLAFTPADAGDHFVGLAGRRFEVLPQVEGDLGQRMAAFFSAQFQAGAAKVVLVGTDSPTLPLSFIAQAFQQLDRAELVLGPATDGGYYLIGCKEPLPPIFKGIAWGTSAVLGETVGRLPDSRWQLALLPPWYDVDTVADWQMLRGHLAALRRAGVDPGLPHTEALIAEG